jgi:hypothetical protein
MEPDLIKLDIDRLITDSDHRITENLNRWQRLQVLIKEEITLNEKSILN